MTAPIRVDYLIAPRFSDLFLQVCGYLGIPTVAGEATPDRFLVRPGREPPEVLVRLLAEALPVEAPEVETFSEGELPNVREWAPGQVAVQAGFGPAGPAPPVRMADDPAGRALIFAVERHSPDGVLLGITWAVVGEEPPFPEAPLRAAVARLGGIKDH